MKDGIIIYQQQAGDLFRQKTSAKRLATGFQFAEGPLWHPGGYLLFSDVKANRIFQLFLSGVIHVLCERSGSQYVCGKYLSEMIGSNGLALDNDGNVVFCQHANHSIAKINKHKDVFKLCTSYNGRPFNSPNDLVVKSDGGIYFTDPPYGLKKEALKPDIFQPHAGVYRFQDNQVCLLSTDFNYPNGICFSIDERYLFVASNHPDEKMIMKYLVSSKGIVLSKQVFAPVNADGIKIDAFNNIYAATNKGVLILSPEGRELALIPLSEPATNLAFGGPDNNLLFITTYHSIYAVEMNMARHELLPARRSPLPLTSTQLYG
ncbi:MAG TPA: SMP-30/gluconolactonase/LRE family protein [Chitinophagaceae bacterium]|nr:SMP-30/gluconolactonase/LRE family protein [Chitinophagaceae bacterium]